MIIKKLAYFVCVIKCQYYNENLKLVFKKKKKTAMKVDYYGAM